MTLSTTLTKVLSQTLSTSPTVYFDVWAKVSSQSIANNTTTVYAEMRIRTSTSYIYDRQGKGSLIINGAKTVSWTYGSNITASEHTVASASYTFTHASDGTKKIYFGETMNLPNWGKSGSKYIYDVALPTIPRESTFTGFSISGFAYDASATFKLTWTAKATVMSHKYKIVVGSTTICNWTTVGSGSTSYSEAFTYASNSFANMNKSGTALKATAYLQTYSGSTKIAESSRTISFSIPSSYAPVLSGFRLTGAVSNTFSSATSPGNYIKSAFFNSSMTEARRTVAINKINSFDPAKIQDVNSLKAFAIAVLGSGADTELTAAGYLSNDGSICYGAFFYDCVTLAGATIYNGQKDYMYTTLSKFATSSVSGTATLKGGATLSSLTLKLYHDSTLLLTRTAANKSFSDFEVTYGPFSAEVNKAIVECKDSRGFSGSLTVADPLVLTSGTLAWKAYTTMKFSSGSADKCSFTNNVKLEGGGGNVHPHGTITLTGASPSQTAVRLAMAARIYGTSEWLVKRRLCIPTSLFATSGSTKIIKLQDILPMLLPFVSSDSYGLDSQGAVITGDIPEDTAMEVSVCIDDGFNRIGSINFDGADNEILKFYCSATYAIIEVGKNGNQIGFLGASCDGNATSREVHIGGQGANAAKLDVTGDTSIGGSLIVSKDINCGQNIYAENNASIYAKTPEDKIQQSIELCNTYGNLTLGYGAYANAKGNTNIYGNAINFTAASTANAAIQANSPTHFKEGITYVPKDDPTALNSMITSGNFYSLGSVANRPANAGNGWLEVFNKRNYSSETGYAYQRYTEQGRGYIWNRLKKAGAWTPWIGEPVIFTGVKSVNVAGKNYVALWTTAQFATAFPIFGNQVAYNPAYDIVVLNNANRDKIAAHFDGATYTPSNSTIYAIFSEAVTCTGGSVGYAVIRMPR